MSKILKNNDLVNDFLINDLGVNIPADSSYTIDPINYQKFADSNDLITAISSADLVYNDGEADLSIAQATAHLQGSYPKAVGVTSTPPFAEPDFRTKRAATTQWESIIADETKTIDFPLSEERYAAGGELLYKNAKEGDYIVAEVYDKDGVIPEAYRAALCEAHPSVAMYIEKNWILPTEADKYASYVINTHPLNAKISGGLYLRVTYYASAEVGTRKLAINYNLTKKL